MGWWQINVWQRALFGLAAIVLLLFAVDDLGDNDFPLLMFIWAIIFGAVALSPKQANGRAE